MNALLICKRQTVKLHFLNKKETAAGYPGAVSCVSETSIQSHH